MEVVKLDVSDRSERGTANARRLRKQGLLPVNLYGLGREPRAMTTSAHELEMALERGHHIVELQQEDKQQAVLIQDVQYDALGSSVLHADLLRIDRDKPVHVHIPIRFIGMAPEVSGSVVDKLLDTVQVEVLPMQIPHEFVINLGEIEVGNAYRVGDLSMAEGCSPFGHNPEDVIVVNHIKVEAEVEEGAEGEEGVEPEVIGRKSDDEGGEG